MIKIGKSNDNRNSSKFISLDNLQFILTHLTGESDSLTELIYDISSSITLDKLSCIILFFFTSYCYS